MQAKNPSKTVHHLASYSSSIADCNTMEGQGYRLAYDSTRDVVDGETSPHRRNYHEDHTDDDFHHHSSRKGRSKLKVTPDKMVSSSARSRRKEKNNYNIDEINSLTDQMRHSSSRKFTSSRDGHISESANQCIQHNFDPATISSAKSIALSLANPCGIDTSSMVNSSTGYLHPITPSTVSSSFSDESYTSYGESLDTSPSLSSQREFKSSRRNNIAKKDDSGGPEIRRSLRSVRITNTSTKDEDTIIFVGNKQYQFPSSRNSMIFASKYFKSKRKEADNLYYVDLTTHCPQDFMTVIGFLEKNSTSDVRGNIHWKNLSVILPWFVEFRALPLTSAVDTFFLHNALPATGDTGHGVSLSNLLALTQVAFACGLENTKLHTRRLLRQALLEPRKQSISSESHNSRISDPAEDIELEWTLQDLKVLSQVLQVHDDLREYLWEVAVIIYLPHDLDISNSIGLVSNNLFPYLLREGMMQMMIVEGIESSYQMTDNSFLTESSVASSSNLSNGKAVGSSFSEHTSCSDTTIPTNPSKRIVVTEKEMQHFLGNILQSLQKFKIEKEARSLMAEETLHNSLIEEDNSDNQKSRPRRGYQDAKKRGTSKATFAC